MSTPVAEPPSIGAVPTYNPLEVYTYDEVANLLKISKKSVQRLVDAGELRTVQGKRSGQVRFSSGEVLRYLYGGDL